MTANFLTEEKARIVLAFWLYEVIEEDQLTGKGWFALTINLQFHIELTFGNALQVEQGGKLHFQTYLITHHYRLVKLELFYAVIDHHFEVANVGNLLPEVGKKR